MHQWLDPFKLPNGVSNWSFDTNTAHIKGYVLKGGLKFGTNLILDWKLP